MLDCDDRTKEAAAADFFALAFEPNVCFAYNAKNTKLLQYLQAIKDTVAFRQLQADTVYDDVASEIAAVKFALEYGKIEGEIFELPPPKKARAKERRGRRKRGRWKVCVLTASIEKAISDAVKKASGEADEVNDMREAFGSGGNGDGARAVKSIVEEPSSYLIAQA